jgi:NAD(P)H dehydrogenase (quinone)
MLSHAAVTASSSTSTADSLARAMAEVDRVLLIATSDFQDRMQQHQNVIDAAKAAAVKLLLDFTSRSLNDMVGPENAMMRDYLQTEALIRESGVPALIFRNALYLDTPPVSLGGPAVFTAHHPGGRSRTRRRTRHVSSSTASIISNGTCRVSSPR